MASFSVCGACGENLLPHVEPFVVSPCDDIVCRKCLPEALQSHEDSQQTTVGTKRSHGQDSEGTHLCPASDCTKHVELAIPISHSRRLYASYLESLVSCPHGCGILCKIAELDKHFEGCDLSPALAHVHKKIKQLEEETKDLRKESKEDFDELALMIAASHTFDLRIRVGARGTMPPQALPSDVSPASASHRPSHATDYHSQVFQVNGIPFRIFLRISDKENVGFYIHVHGGSKYAWIDLASQFSVESDKDKIETDIMRFRLVGNETDFALKKELFDPKNDYIFTEGRQTFVKAKCSVYVKRFVSKEMAAVDMESEDLADEPEWEEVPF